MKHTINNCASLTSTSSDTTSSSDNFYDHELHGYCFHGLLQTRTRIPRILLLWPQGAMPVSTDIFYPTTVVSHRPTFLLSRGSGRISVCILTLTHPSLHHLLNYTPCTSREWWRHPHWVVQTQMRSSVGVWSMVSVAGRSASRVICPFTASHFRRPAAALRTYSDLPL